MERDVGGKTDQKKRPQNPCKGLIWMTGSAWCGTSGEGCLEISGYAIPISGKIVERFSDCDFESPRGDKSSKGFKCLSSQLLGRRTNFDRDHHRHLRSPAPTFWTTRWKHLLSVAHVSAWSSNADLLATEDIDSHPPIAPSSTFTTLEVWTPEALHVWSQVDGTASLISRPLGTNSIRHCLADPPHLPTQLRSFFSRFFLAGAPASFVLHGVEKKGRDSRGGRNPCMRLCILPAFSLFFPVIMRSRPQATVIQGLEGGGSAFSMSPSRFTRSPLRLMTASGRTLLGPVCPAFMMKRRA